MALTLSNAFSFQVFISYQSSRELIANFIRNQFARFLSVQREKGKANSGDEKASLESFLLWKTIQTCCYGQRHKYSLPQLIFCGVLLFLLLITTFKSLQQDASVFYLLTCRTIFRQSGYRWTFVFQSSQYYASFITSFSHGLIKQSDTKIFGQKRKLKRNA